MKRCWLGGLLLALLLAGGLITSRWMGRFSLSLSDELLSAAELTGEDRTAAQEKADQARISWEARRKFAAILSDHEPMDEIQANFALLTPAAEEEDFREICLALSAQLQALGHGQLLTWENLF